MGFDFNILLQYKGLLFHGLLVSFQLTLIAIVGGMIIGTGLALMRMSSIWIVSALAGAYVNFLRSLPLILVIFWFYVLRRRSSGIRSTPSSSVLIAFILFEGGVLLRDHPRRHFQRQTRTGAAGLAMGFHSSQHDAPRRAAAGVPQHAAGAADSGDHHVLRTPRLFTSSACVTSSPPPT